MLRLSKTELEGIYFYFPSPLNMPLILSPTLNRSLLPEEIVSCKDWCQQCLIPDLSGRVRTGSLEAAAPALLSGPKYFTPSLWPPSSAPNSSYPCSSFLSLLYFWGLKPPSEGALELEFGVICDILSWGRNTLIIPNLNRRIRRLKRFAWKRKRRKNRSCYGLREANDIHDASGIYSAAPGPQTRKCMWGSRGPFI